MLALSLYSFLPAWGQQTPDDCIAPSTAPYQISLITCAPGQEIYQLEGHSGLRIQGEDVDVVANWGLFDFDSPGFVYRFTKGETDYCVGVAPTPAFLYPYKREGRKVVEQVLNLTPEQAIKVVKLVERNLEPANRVYRYNYVKDNCATRPWLLVQKALAPDTIVVIRYPEVTDSGRELTFRNVMRHYHAHYPWYQFGIDLALGSGIDYPLAPDEIAFAPVALEQMAANAIVASQGEMKYPLVKESIVLVEGWDKEIVLPPTPFIFTPLAVSILVLLIVAGVTYRDVKRIQSSHWLDCVLFSVYGLAGCVIAFLVFISVHEAASPNLLLLWLNPFCLIVTVTVWLKKARNFLLCYHFANFAALLAFAILWMLSEQSGNWAFLPLVLADATRSMSYIYIYRCQRKRDVTSKYPITEP